MSSGWRWMVIAVLLSLLSMTGWQGGRVVLAAPAPVAPAGTGGETGTAAKKTLDDYLTFIYQAMPPLARTQVSLEDFIACNKGIKYVHSLRPEQISGLDFDKLIEYLKEVDFARQASLLVQFDPRMQQQKVVETLPTAYELYYETGRAKLPFPAYRDWMIAQISKIGGDTVTWGDLNAWSKANIANNLERMKESNIFNDGDYTWFSELWFTSPAGKLCSDAALIPVAVAEAAGETVAATVKRVLDVSPLVTISLRRGHSFDGYLLPRETMGKDPAQYIGVRPANYGNNGIFSGVMVVRRSDIASITFFDEESRAMQDLSLAAFMQQYMFTDAPAV